VSTDEIDCVVAILNQALRESFDEMAASRRSENKNAGGGLTRRPDDLFSYVV
jgi:hypothetical protein